MVGTSISVYCCEESLSIQRTWATYRARSARAHWGSNDRSVAHPSESFLGGVPAIGTNPERHWAVYFWQTAYRSPYYHLFLGQCPGVGQVSDWRSVIDECLLPSMFCPINILCCHPYYVPLRLLFGS